MAYIDRNLYFTLRGSDFYVGSLVGRIESGQSQCTTCNEGSLLSGNTDHTQSTTVGETAIDVCRVLERTTFVARVN